MKNIAALFCVFIIITSCTSIEIGNSKDVNPETIYMQYSLSYNSNEDSVNCFLQYRFAGENGTTLILSEPSSVSIDGYKLTVDSGNMSGAYYQRNFAAKDFQGDHVIEYSDINGKVKKQEFEFHAITCSNDLSMIDRNKDLVLNFDNYHPGDVAHIIIEDTSEATDDINIDREIENGKIVLPATQLRHNLKTGPCNMEISAIKEKALHTTEEGGKLSVYIGIKNIETILK